MTNELPGYVTMIFAILFILTYPGTYLIVEDLRKKLKSHAEAQELRVLLNSFQFRRIISLLTGIGLLIAHFRNTRMVLFVAIIFSVLWLETVMKIQIARQTLEKY